jgi:hypothetical protein
MTVMALRQKVCGGLLLAALVATGGCGVQDSDQPAVGSISVPAGRDDNAPTLAPRKTAPDNRQ